MIYYYPIKAKIIIGVFWQGWKMLRLVKPRSQRDKNWKYLGLGQVPLGWVSRLIHHPPKNRHGGGEQPCCIPVGTGMTSQMALEVMVGPGCNSKAESASLPAVLSLLQL